MSAFSFSLIFYVLPSLDLLKHISWEIHRNLLFVYLRFNNIMLKCTDWNMCNILQFSHSVNVHFKQPYWNGTIWKPYFMCQRGDVPEHWLFSWTDLPKHPDFSYGWLFAPKRIQFWMEMDPWIPLEVDLCWRGDCISWENCSRSCSFCQTPGPALLQGNIWT